MSRVYANRMEAGRELAAELCSRLLPRGQAAARHTARHPPATGAAPAKAAPRIVVYGLPRGGVPVAAEVARALHAPLDLLIVRKVGAPGQPELAVGAVADGVPPEVVLDEQSMAWTGTSEKWVREQARIEHREVLRRRQAYLAGRVSPPVQGMTAVVVDDGAATGTTVRAAVQALRRRGPARIVLALPVAPGDVLAQLRPLVDDVVCLAEPVPFRAVGLHYGDFHQVSDEEVVRALQEVSAQS
jgi:putative phosphoribosyl transferase